MKRVLVKECKNGTKIWETTDTCYKCGGSGIYQWGAVVNGYSQYQGVCYSCNGTGKVTIREREYTAEHAAELEAKRQKKIDEAAAKYAEEQKRREEEAAKRQAEIEARKAVSQFVGKEGDKISGKFTFAFSSEYLLPSFRGWGTTTMRIYGLRDEHGNLFIWKTNTGWLGVEHVDEFGHSDYDNAVRGDVVEIKATIKEHAEYNGEKQTVLTRVKTLAVEHREEV